MASGIKIICLYETETDPFAGMYRGSLVTFCLINLATAATLTARIKTNRAESYPYLSRSASTSNLILALFFFSSGGSFNSSPFT